MEDIKLNSTESIPRQFIEKAEDANREVKRDENFNAVKDSNGNYVYEVNSKGVRGAIREFASHFADFGVDINQIDFDDYLVEGVTLDKIPRGALTIIQIRDSSRYNPNSKFYVFDKRRSSSRENPLWESTSRRLYHSRKGKTVDAGRIPDYQFLESAENIWVVPEEVLTRDTVKIRQERRDRKAGRVERLKELPYKYYGYRSEDPRRLDPSGYVIDPGAIREKLNKYKKEKELKAAGSHLAIAEREIKAVVDEYNEMAKIIMSVATDQLSKGDLRIDLSVVSSVNKEIKGIVKNILVYAGYLDKGTDYTWYFESYLKDLKKIKNSSVWRDFESTYRLALEEQQINSSTEGTGCKYNRTLQATEGYFTDQKILAAFEENM